MKKITNQHTYLFVEARSRIGLIHPPYGESDINCGVELGPASVLEHTFIDAFPNHKKIMFSFDKPETIQQEEYFEVLALNYRSLMHEIEKQYDKNTTLITVGGDHSVSFGSIASLINHHNPLTTGIIMIDSHTDLHQPSTTHSGNFHGMWLRGVLDDFEVSSINRLLPIKVPTTNLLYIGNIDNEIEEQKYIAKHNIKIVNRDEVNSHSFISRFENYLQKIEHIHISIDIDAFSHEFAPATGMMIRNGLQPADIFPILSYLSSHQSVSIDLVEVNPLREGNNQTIKLAQKLIKVATGK